MSPTPTKWHAASLQNWTGIGDYLRRDRVQLVPPEKRQSLLISWEEITHQEENLDDAILIGLVGGTGVGKSTFINALAGQEVSRSSDRRPTTDRVIVYRHVNAEISGDVPRADFAQPEVLHDNAKMEKVVLFDFPDFDSAEDSHTHIIRRHLPFLDVLLVVVDDVKYADRRLYELLSTLDHDQGNVFVLLNKTDRLQERYGDQSEQVINELVADLDQKLRANSGLHLETAQVFPVAALSVFQSRLRDQPSPALERFLDVERMLESFQIEKHRRAAKERNIDSRKRDLIETLADDALGKENEAILLEAKSLVLGWRGELDKALRSVPVEVLSESERRGVRGARLRQVGPSWGLPFSLFFTLLGEIRRRSSKAVEPSDLGQRVMYHYRSFFEAIKNVRARFTSEFAGSKINLTTLPELEAADIVRLSTKELGADLQRAVQQEREPVAISRRGLAHVPGLGALFLAFWGQIYDVLDGDAGIFGALFDSLSPTFIVGTILGVIFVYGLTAFVIWLREIQLVDHAVTTAEQRTRESVRETGQEAVDQLDEDVKLLYEEFEQLQELISR